MKNFILLKKKEYQENMKNVKQEKIQIEIKKANNLKRLSEAIEQNKSKIQKNSQIMNLSYYEKKSMGNTPFQATPIDKKQIIYEENSYLKNSTTGSLLKNSLMKNSPKNSMKNSSKNSMKNSPKNSPKNSMKNSIKNSPQNSPRNSLKNSVKNSLKNSVKNSLKNSIKNSLKNSLKNSFKNSLKNPRNQCDEYIDGPHNLLTASFANQMSRIPTENEHLDERIEIEEIDKSSSFSERNFLSSENNKNSNKFLENDEKSKENPEEKLNEAANFIQRIWRGFKTRQLIEEYLKYMLMGREEEEEQYLEYFPEERVNSMKEELMIPESNNSHEIIKKEEPLALIEKIASNSLTGEEMIIYKESTEKEEDFDGFLDGELMENQEIVEKVEDFQKEYQKIRENNHKDLKSLILDVRKSLEKNEN